MLCTTIENIRDLMHRLSKELKAVDASLDDTSAAVRARCIAHDLEKELKKFRAESAAQRKKSK